MPVPPGFKRPTPKWAYIAGGVGILGLAYLWWRNKQNSAASTATNTLATSSATAPTLDSTGYLSGVTDTSNNLPFEDTWPYNQLALPYNYNGSTSATVNSNANDVLPYNANATPTDNTGTAAYIPNVGTINAPIGVG
jgi:hypothetical protein